MSMTLNELANLGEFIGGIAVIVTLIYLTVQLRQNTRAVKSATVANNTSLWSALLVNIAAGDKTKAYLHGSATVSVLTPEEFLQFFLIARAMFVSFEGQHHQFKEGMLDQDLYDGYERSFQAQVLSMPGFRRYWKQFSHEFSPAFQTRIETMLKDQPAADANRLLNDWKNLAE